METGQDTLSPEMINRIEKVLNKVKEPETFRSVSELGLVKKVTYSAGWQRMIVYTDIEAPRSTCAVCYVVTETIRESIQRDLQEAFEKEFPELSITVE